MAAAEGKFVWLETLRKARKTSLVQDGKWRILALALLQVQSSIWQPVIIIVNKKNRYVQHEIKESF